jgi:N-acetylglucosaminyldiphosphoundecaprenol N-acetyl-beta-D-mannosaminyltransferase
VFIDSLTEQLAAEALPKLMSKKHSLICTPNVEFIIRAQNDDEFRDILARQSSLNCADGIATLWALRFLTWKSPRIPVIRELVIFLEWILSIILIPILPGLYRYPIPQRLSGSDFIWTIARFAADNNYRVFLLGGAPTVAERASLVLQTQIHNLKVAGVHSGSPKDTPKILEAVNKSHSDILLVAFGAPKQEKWLSENLSKTSCHIGIGLGGTFDFIAEIRRRAPAWMRRSGLEWLYRLAQEPSRIARQMSIPKFLYLVLIKRLRSRDFLDK